MLLAGKLYSCCNLEQLLQWKNIYAKSSFFTVALTNLDDKENAKKAYDQAVTLDM